MAETIAECHFRDRIQSLQKLISLPQPDRAALSKHDHAELVTLCSELSQSARDLMAKEFDRIFRNPKLTVALLQETRQAIVELTDMYVELAQTMKAKFSAQQGVGAPNGNDFVQILDNAIQRVAEA